MAGAWVQRAPASGAVASSLGHRCGSRFAGASAAAGRGHPVLPPREHLPGLHGAEHRPGVGRPVHYIGHDPASVGPHERVMFTAVFS